MSALTIIIPALIVAAIIIYAAVLVHAWRHWDGPHSHTFDCRDWRRTGQRDITCLADHPTNWFVPTESEKNND